MTLTQLLSRGRVAVIATAAMAATVTAGFGADSVMTPQQLAGLKVMTSVEISPDGARIAAVRTVPRSLLEQENGAAWAELHVLDVSTGASHPFVTGMVNVSSVKWLPDGAAISFIAKRDGDKNKCLYMIPLSGGEARQVTKFDADVLSYTWNPDGSKVAIIAKPPVSDEDKELDEEGFDQEVYEEDWRPRSVWIADLTAGDADPVRLDIKWSAYQVRWSPDGGMLAIALAPRPLVDDEYMYQKIHVISATNGETLGVVDHAGKLGRVAWSPNGKNLAIVAGVDMNDPAESSLLVAPASGGSATNLTDGWAGQVNAVAWRGDNTVLFLGDMGTTTDLFTVPISGESSPKALGVSSDSAVFTRMSASANGAHVGLIGESPTHPGEVFSANIASATAQRLTDSNPWLDAVRFGRQEVIRYNARDGLEIEGVLVYPVDYEPGTRYPLVLVVHGGPEAHYRNGWMNRYSRPGQILAGRGFAVFFPNYRGSTGRGVEFSKTSQGDPAGKEFDDLVDGVDHLVKMGLVDGKRVGITGGSYGGYATAWGATRYSDRFAAGVMFVGISNKHSKIGTTDIPDEEYYVHALKRVYDDVPFFLERSPISYVEQARTPLLIMHGEDDPRVSVTQSKELYRALKVLGKTPVRLVLYKGEGHGNRKAAARYDYMLRSLRWMEHYLQGPGGDPPPYSVDYELSGSEESP